MKLNKAWDLCAAGLSSLCLVHCLLLPFAVALLPTAAQFSENETVHLVLVMLAAPVTCWVVWGFLKNHDRGIWFPLAALTGISFLLAAVFLPPLAPYEMEVTVVGSVLVAGAHLWRWSTHTYQHGNNGG